MNNLDQETSLDIQETEFGATGVSKQRRIIHFSSGETLEEEDSEEEEEQLGRPPFTEPAKKTRLSFKNVAILIGKISLLTCDFLGERLAAALGLNAAKYQYAIDQFHRDHKTASTQTEEAEEALREGKAEMTHPSSTRDWSHYGAVGNARRPVNSPESCDEKHIDRNKGLHNRGYQADEDNLE